LSTLQPIGIWLTVSSIEASVGAFSLRTGTDPCAGAIAVASEAARSKAAVMHAPLIASASRHAAVILVIRIERMYSWPVPAADLWRDPWYALRL
jgi:hypothetical protein